MMIEKNKTVSTAFLLLLLFSLTSCAITGRVSTATYTTPPQNSTFAIMTNTMLTLTEEKVQKHIISKMESLGFELIDDVKQADYIVIYSYDIGGGQTYVSSSPDFVFGGQKVSSHTEYPRYFHIGLVDSIGSVQANKIIYAFKGEVYSSGSSSNIAYLAKYFIDQIFVNFGLNVDDKRFVVVPTQ